MRRFLAAALALPAGCFLLPFMGFGQDHPPKPPRTEFAADRVADRPSDKLVFFESQRANLYLDAIRALGPRTSGSEAMRRQQDLLQKHFEDLGARVVFQPFEHQKGVRPSALSNIVVSWHPERDRRIILCTHYESQPKPAAVPMPVSLREQAFPGVARKKTEQRKSEAGGEPECGVALLMELGNHMRDLKPKLGVDFVFLDAHVPEQSDAPAPPGHSRGIDHFLKSWREGKGRPRYVAAVLLDVSATAAVPFVIEGNSWSRSRAVVREIWGVAAELRAGAFVARVGERVADDHLALMQAGIAAVDVSVAAQPPVGVAKQLPSEIMPQLGSVLAEWLQRREK